jgi:hypothetical protein
LRQGAKLIQTKKKRKWMENKLRQWVIGVWRGKQTDWHFHQP